MKTTAIKNEDGKVIGAHYDYTPSEVKEIENCPQCESYLLTPEKIEQISGFLQGKGYSHDQIGNALALCEAYCENQAKECEIKSVSQGGGGGGDEDVDTGLLVAVIKEIGKASKNTVVMAQEIRESINALQVDKSDLQNSLFEAEQVAKRALGKMELTVEQLSTELADELNARLDSVESNLRGHSLPAPSTQVTRKAFSPTQHFLTEYEKAGFNPNIGYDPHEYFDVPIQRRGKSTNRGRGEWESIGMPGS